jgi:Lipase (class 3)
MLGTGAGCAADTTDPGNSELEVRSVGQTLAIKVRAERTAAYSLDNAYWMAMLSGAAYAEQATLPAALAGVGIKVSAPGYELKTFDVFPSSQAFYLATPDAAFLVFRGSSDAIDWTVTNSDSTPRSGFAPGARVHTGFARSAENLWDGGLGKGDMGAFLRKRHTKAGGKPLYVGGHSLGGALAVLVSQLALFDGCRQSQAWRAQPSSLASEPCRANYIPIEAVYTFGQPVVGDSGFADLFAARLPVTKTKYVRVVNVNDVVAAAPAGFPHVNGETKGVYSTLLGLSRAGRLMPYQNPLGSADDRKVKPTGETTCEKQEVTDHTLTTYIAKIRANAEHTPWVGKACE